MAKKGKEKQEKKPIKNYVILVLLFLAVIALTVYLCECYKVYNEEQKKIPVIRGTLTSEITEVDVEPFIVENPTTVLYMCTSSSEKCRNFEKDFKKLIKKYELQDSIIYLNLSNIEDQESFVEEFNDRHPYKKSKLTSNYPAIVYLDDGKVKNIIQGKDNEKLSITKVKSFIEINKIGE